MYCVYVFIYLCIEWMQATVFIHIHPVWCISSMAIHATTIEQSARQHTRHGPPNIKSFPDFAFITLFIGFCNKYLPFFFQKWDNIMCHAGSAECLLNNMNHVESWLQMSWFYLKGKFTNTTYLMLVIKRSNMLCCPYKDEFMSAFTTYSAEIHFRDFQKHLLYFDKACGMFF